MAESDVDISPDEDMQLEYVTDKGGSKLKLQVVDGQYYPTFPADVIRNLASLKIRSDDVILAGYLKAGTHWVWEILRMLLAGATVVPDEEKDQGMLEQTEQNELEEMRSPRVLNTHVHFEKLPTDILTKDIKIVYLTRNVKDTAVSLYHHHRKLWDYYSYDGTFENYLHLFFEGKVDYGSWFDHIQNWSEVVIKYPNLSIIEVNYEDLSKNPEMEIQKLIKFFDLSISTELIEEIIKECSLDNMREKKGRFDLDCDGNSIMYRKGKVGDWKNYFNSETSWFDEAYEAKMASITTPFHWKFELD